MLKLKPTHKTIQTYYRELPNLRNIVQIHEVAVPGFEPLGEPFLIDLKARGLPTVNSGEFSV